MPVDRPAILPLPIPGRFEQREEYDRARDWRSRFATELAPFLETWAPRGVDFLKLIDLLTIPYVPRWTFGEELAALLEPAGSTGTRTPGQAASYALETLAAVLIQGFAKVDLLASSRDEYVHASRSLAQNRRSEDRRSLRIFVSYTASDHEVAREITRSLNDAPNQDLEVLNVDAQQFAAGENWSDQLRREIEQADAFVVVVGPTFSSSKGQQQEVEWFLRQSLRSEQTKTIVPIVLKGGEKAFSSSRLADYQAVFFDPKIGFDKPLQSVLSRLSRVRSQLRPIAAG
jgi:TIR domain